MRLILLLVWVFLNKGLYGRISFRLNFINIFFLYLFFNAVLRAEFVMEKLSFARSKGFVGFFDQKTKLFCLRFKLLIFENFFVQPFFQILIL